MLARLLRREGYELRANSKSRTFRQSLLLAKKNIYSLSAGSGPSSLCSASLNDHGTLASASTLARRKKVTAIRLDAIGVPRLGSVRACAELLATEEQVERSPV